MTSLMEAELKYFHRIATGFDIAPVVRALERNDDLWDKDSFRKKGRGSPHSRMSDIWVRYNDQTKYAESGDWSGFNDAHDSVWYPAYYRMPELKLPIFRLMRLVEGERLGGVLITRIPAGMGIDPHVDAGWHVDYYDKYYLSLKSAPGATFHCGDDVINPKPGDIYKFDNMNTHWVKNDSKQDRITLIICIRSNRAIH